VKRKTLHIITLTIAALLMCTSYAVATNHASPKKTAKQQKAEWLFVISANQASIKKTKNARFTIRTKLTNMGNIIAFEKQPGNYVTAISPKNLKINRLHRVWTKGKNSFAMDPPNAVISTSGKPALIATVESIDLKSRVFTFTLRPLLEEIDLKKTALLKNMVLTIDATGSLTAHSSEFWLDNHCCSFTAPNYDLYPQYKAICEEYHPQCQPNTGGGDG
jgi:hypothetical protein